MVVNQTLLPPPAPPCYRTGESSHTSCVVFVAHEACDPPEDSFARRALLDAVFVTSGCADRPPLLPVGAAPDSQEWLPAASSCSSSSSKVTDPFSAAPPTPPLLFHPCDIQALCRSCISPPLSLPPPCPHSPCSPRSALHIYARTSSCPLRGSKTRP